MANSDDMSSDLPGVGPEPVLPYRIMLMFTSVGTFDELAAVIDGAQEDAEKRGLFADIAMINMMPLEELDDFDDDHPVNVMMQDHLPDA